MRLLAFLIVTNLAVPAYACGWTYVDSPPLAFLWCSIFIANLGGLFYARRGHRKGSWLPEAIIAVAVLAGLGLGALFGTSEWSAVSEANIAVLLVFPWVGMYHRDKIVLQCIVGFLAFVSLIGALGTFEGRAVSSFTNSEVVTDIEF